MVDRTASDEHYVLDLCDKVLGVGSIRQATFDWLRGDPYPLQPLGKMLPVDGFWSDLKLVVEFQEEQHSKPSPFFDRRQTISGVGRGEQRRLYDERKRRLIREHGCHLVVIEKSSFVIKSRRIMRNIEMDLAVIRQHIGSYENKP